MNTTNQTTEKKPTTKPVAAKPAPAPKPAAKPMPTAAKGAPSLPITAPAPAPATVDPNALDTLPIVAKPTKAGDHMGEGRFFLPGARPTPAAIMAAVRAAVRTDTQVKQAILSEDGGFIWCRLVIDGEEDFWALSRDKDAQTIRYTGSYTSNRAAWAALDASGFLAADKARKDAQAATRAADKAKTDAAKAVIDATLAKANPAPAPAAKPAAKAPAVALAAPKAATPAPAPAKPGKASPFSKKA